MELRDRVVGLLEPDACLLRIGIGGLLGRGFVLRGVVVG